MTGAARLADVASVAGVSVRTASRVLNGDHRVASTTRARVSRAIDELQFEPDVTARSLRAGTDTAIGLAVESIADPFFAEVIDTVEAEMARHGRPVLVASTHGDPGHERAVVRRMQQRRIAGLLVAPTGRDSSWLQSAAGPVILLDRGVAGAAADLVDIDDHRAAVDAVTHLIRHGHRRIGYLGDSLAVPTSAARLRGYRDALRIHGLEVRDELIHSSARTSEDAATATNALLSLAGANAGRGPTALFSATTRSSLGAIPVLHAHGRTDIGFIGLGDFAMADALVPGVTVIDHSGRRMGLAAARRLLARLDDPFLPVEHLRLPTPLIARGSGEVRP